MTGRLLSLDFLTTGYANWLGEVIIQQPVG